jgi:putative ABC transport system permease protein
MLQDLRLACRRLRSAPLFTSVAVLTLALAIGTNTAIFTIADVVLFKPLPYSDPENVYVLGTVDAESRVRSRAVRAEYVHAINDFHRGLGEVGLRGPTTFMYHSTPDGTEDIETLEVTAGYFGVLGVRPARGRLFDSRDALEPGRLAVLTYESWQRRFGGDEDIVRRVVRLGSEVREVIGVLPRGFILPTTSLRRLYYATGRPEFITVMLPPVDTAQFDEAVVRLEPGVSLEQAQAEIDALVRPLRAGRNDLVILESPRALLFPTGRPVMQFLVAAAAFVLLIGCANLANMLLARTRRREREIGLHAALGATRLRIVRAIFFETLIVGVASALLALVVTALAFDFLIRQVPPVAYGNVTVGLDVRVAAFSVVLGIVAGVLFAVLPAWWSARLDVHALVDGRPSGEGRRLRGFGPMITTQVALAVVLVFGAVIAGRAFIAVLQIPLGFSPDNLMVINARPLGRNPDLNDFYARAVDTLSRRADVAVASAGSSIPPDGFGSSEGIETSGSQRPVDVIHVLPGYFETLGIPLREGRLLTRDDLRRGDVAVVSESAARALFPDGNVLGATLRSRDIRSDEARQLTVIGIVGDVQRSVSRPLGALAYALPPPNANRGMTIVARVRARGPQTLDDARREIVAITPGAPVTGEWWSTAIADQAGYRNPRFQTLVLVTFAVIGLTLAALGVFGAVAFLVASRTREMGVRLALGAEPRSLVRMVVRQALAPVLTGLLAGLVGTIWLRHVAEAQLINVNARDSAMVVASVMTVAIAAALAAYLPARQVTKVDPAGVLRAE